jgi:hypothetical protein
MNEINIKNAYLSHLGPMMDGETENFKNDYLLSNNLLDNICIIYGNCQGKHLEYILNQSNFFKKKYITYYYPNYELINSKIDLNINFINLLKNCKLFIYQPVKKNHGIYSTSQNIDNNIYSYLSIDCIKISFIYINNIALDTFLYETFDSNMNSIDIKILYNIEEMKIINTKFYIFYNYFGFKNIFNFKLNKNMNNIDIMTLFDNNLLDFNFEERWTFSFNILKDSEKITDIKISDFIENNYKNIELFYTNNHPTNYIFLEIVNQIFNKINIPKLDYNINWNNLDIRRIHYDKYNINYYNLNFVEENNNYTREHLLVILNKIDNLII